MKIKEERERLNLTQEDMAYQANVSLRFYQLVERGKSVPNVKIALRICRLLNVDPRDIDEWK